MQTCMTIFFCQITEITYAVLEDITSNYFLQNTILACRLCIYIDTVQMYSEITRGAKGKALIYTHNFEVLFVYVVAGGQTSKQSDG